jgi:hypothetical protein
MTRKRMVRRAGLVLTVALLGGSAVTALAAEDTLQGWKVAGITSVIALSAVDETPKLTTLRFQNVSGKAVGGFCVSFGVERKPPLDCKDSFSGVISSIAPNVIVPVRITPDLVVRSGRLIQMLAAVFEDGTSEGSHVDFLIYRRIGAMLEVERIKSILEDPNGHYEGPGGAEALTARLGRDPKTNAEAVESVRGITLPGLSVDSLTFPNVDADAGFRGGLGTTRFLSLQDAKRLGDLPASAVGPHTLTQATFLSQLRQKYESASARHHAFCEHTPLGGVKR